MLLSGISDFYFLSGQMDKIKQQIKELKKKKNV